VKSIAFPAISTGVYRYPKVDAARIALTSMLNHEREYERIVACLFDDEAVSLYKDVLTSLRRSR
jgi:O-acetyl-ADP-ribose deacetylase